MDQTTVIVLAGAVLVFVFAMMGVAASRYRKVGPDEALVISGGRTGLRIVRGGGTFVYPVLESAQKLSLKIVTLYSRTSAFHEKLGASTTIEVMAQVKVDSSSEKALVSAAEQFLGLGEEGIAKVTQQVLDGHVRAVLGTLEAEHIFAEREKLAEKLRLLVGADLGMVGLTLVTLTLGSNKEIDAPALVAH